MPAPGKGSPAKAGGANAYSVTSVRSANSKAIPEEAGGRPAPGTTHGSTPRKPTKNTNPFMTGPMHNLMWDPRVKRGPTFLHKGIQEEEVPPPKKHVKPVKYVVREIGTPEPVKGRKHLDVQTDQYLEELEEKIAEYDVDTQTDPFLDRPATPLYIPVKSGPDKWTQIEDGDLFDFDMEVEPMLEVLVGRTLEQSLLEVMEEQQLALLRSHQAHYEKVRMAELVATQRMEASERRMLEEKERRKRQERERLLAEKLLAEKVDAQKYARWYLRGLKNYVLDQLAKEGYFFDPVEREVETMYLPLLKTHMLEELEKSRLSISVLNGLVSLTAPPCTPESLLVAQENLEALLQRVLALVTATDVLGDVMLDTTASHIALLDTTSHMTADALIDVSAEIIAEEFGTRQVLSDVLIDTTAERLAQVDATRQVLSDTLVDATAAGLVTSGTTVEVLGGLVNDAVDVDQGTRDVMRNLLSSAFQPPGPPGSRP